MSATPIAREVGNTANYTTFTGHPSSMDLPASVGTHIRHAYQPPQNQASRGDCKSTIHGDREFDGGIKISSRV
jgi:hypothetical protein